MLETTRQKVAATPELHGEASALLEQLGSTAALSEVALVSATMALQRGRDLASLRRFLSGYQQEVLIPVELPAVYRAWWHAGRGEARELIALDQRFAREL